MMKSNNNTMVPEASPEANDAATGTTATPGGSTSNRRNLYLMAGSALAIVVLILCITSPLTLKNDDRHHSSSSDSNGAGNGSISRIVKQIKETNNTDNVGTPPPPQYINLQNSHLDNITTEAVFFNTSSGAELKGTVYKPAANATIMEEGSQQLPAAIVTGAWTTVKEQMAGTYARELAARGMLALTFDFTGWGESSSSGGVGGSSTQRYIEDPVVKTSDIMEAEKYLLEHREDVNKSMVYGLGICASAGYMADAAANNASKIQKVALVAPWLHDPALAQVIYGGPEATAGLIALSEQAATAAARNNSDTSNTTMILVAASITDSSAVMYQAPYYTEENRGLIEEYDNKFNVLGWKPWLTYDAMSSADRLTKPLLMVGSDGMALPGGAAAYVNRTPAPQLVEKVWVDDDVTQFDFYDRTDIVAIAADAVFDFFMN